MGAGTTSGVCIVETDGVNVPERETIFMKRAGSALSIAVISSSVERVEGVGIEGTKGGVMEAEASVCGVSGADVMFSKPPPASRAGHPTRRSLGGGAYDASAVRRGDRAIAQDPRSY